MSNTRISSVDLAAIEIKPQLQPVAFALYQEWSAINDGLRDEAREVDLVQFVNTIDAKFGLVLQAVAALEDAVACRTGETLGGLPVTPDGQVVIAVKEDPDGEGPDVITL